MKVSLELLEKNIGKYCIVKESAVAGLKGQRCKILSVKYAGTLSGFRYEVAAPENIVPGKKTNRFFPPYFNVEILDDSTE